MLTTIATILAWAVWLLVIGRTDPATVGGAGRLLFYLALFTAVGGSASLIGLFVRRHHPERTRAISIALRQGTLTALAVIVAVFLQSRDLLTWFNLIFLVVALTLLELFVISLQRRAPEESTNAG